MFWTLFLAHLIADYPLQTDAMARAKRHWSGLIPHVAVHLLVMLLLAGTARLRIWPQLLVLAAAHFAIDSFKNFSAARWPRRGSYSYVLDQALHVVSLLLVAAWIDGATGIVRDRWWTPYASGYLLATYVWLITERVLGAANEVALSEAQAEPWRRMGVRAVALTLYLLAGRALLAAPLAGLAVVASARHLPYRSGPRPRRALLVDLLVPLVVAALLLFFA